MIGCADNGKCFQVCKDGYTDSQGYKEKEVFCRNDQWQTDLCICKLYILNLIQFNSWKKWRKLHHAALIYTIAK